MDSFCNSTFWNANTTWDTEKPDFTVCFEETVLVWIPCIFLWLFSFVDIYHIRHSKCRDIPWSILSISKLAIIGALITSTFIDFFLLKFFLNVGKEISQVNIYTPVIKSSTWTLSGLFVICNRKYGVRTSGVQCTFWLLSVLCGAPQVRTQIQDLYSSSSIIFLKYLHFLISYVYQVLLLILNFFIDKPANCYNYKMPPKECAIETSGFFSRIFFTWLNPLMMKGSQATLKQDDIWSLKHSCTCEAIFPKFYKCLLNSFKKKQKLRNRRSSAAVRESVPTNLEMALLDFEKTNVSILPALYKICRRSFLYGFFLKICYDVLSFTNPILLHIFLIYIQRRNRLWHGVLYAVCFLLTGVMQALIHSQYFYCMHLIGMRVRSALLLAIYRKSLYLSDTAKLSNSVTEILNYMEIDVQIFGDLLPFVHMIWSAPLYLFVSMLYLWYLLGNAVFTGLAVVMILVPSNLGFVKWEHLLRSVQNLYKYDRLRLLTEYLDGRKVFKLNGWDPYFLDKIQRVREKEIDSLKKAAYLQASIVSVFSLTSFAVVLFTFMTFLLIDEKNVLTPEIAFVSLTIFANMHFSVGLLPLVLVWLIEAYISTIRLNRFLNCEELFNVSHDPSYDEPVVIENGNFSWGQAAPVLQDINIQFEQGKLTAIVGDVKSGKSSLISAILGDMRVLSGFVNVLNSTAYVPQKDWLQATTLRENIIFGKSFDEKWYRKVVEKCVLEEDFNMLDEGDQSFIDKIQLTVSQKQKISLARAIYSKADLYLLDSPLTTVDRSTRRYIFQEVLGPNGLLKTFTRILATSNLEYLYLADNIIVLHTGKVSETGTLIELINANGEFFTFLNEYVEENLEHEEFYELASLLGKSIKPNPSTSKKFEKNDVYVTEDDDRINVYVEEVLDERVQWKIIFFYLASIGILPLISIIVCNFMYILFVISIGMWLSKWATDKDFTTASRLTYMEVYGVLGLGQTLFVYLSCVTLYIGCLHAAQKIHNIMLHIVIRAIPNSADKDEILVKFSKDLDSLDNTLPMIVKGWVFTLTTFVAIFFIVSYAVPLFIALIIPISLSFYLVQRFYIDTFIQLTRLEINAKNRCYIYFRNCSTGASLIRAYDEVDASLKTFGEKVDYNQSCRFLCIGSERWLMIRLEILCSVIIFFTVLFAVLEENPHPGYVGLALSFGLRAAQILDGFVVTSSDIQTEMRAVENVRQLKKLPSETIGFPSQSVPPTWPYKGIIIFQNVSINVGETQVLKNINIVIAGGEKIGVVGKSGSGKSALALSLFRLLRISEGEIIIDGMTITKLSLQTLRSHLTIVPQETVLISGSIKLNLDPYRKFKDADMWLALERANLKDFVEASPFSLNQMINEGGEQLPLNVQQQICLARGLVRQTKILVMDEATSALDLETDVRIHKRIRDDFEDTTIITITSNLNAIIDSDRILVLRNGNVAEFDSPKNLLKDNESLFYRMCADAKIV